MTYPLLQISTDILGCNKNSIEYILCKLENDKQNEHQINTWF